MKIILFFNILLVCVYGRVITLSKGYTRARPRSNTLSAKSKTNIRHPSPANFIEALKKVERALNLEDYTKLPSILDDYRRKHESSVEYQDYFWRDYDLLRKYSEFQQKYPGQELPLHLEEEFNQRVRLE